MNKKNNKRAKQKSQLSLSSSVQKRPKHSAEKRPKTKRKASLNKENDQKRKKLGSSDEETYQPKRQNDFVKVKRKKKNKNLTYSFDEESSKILENSKPDRKYRDNGGSNLKGESPDSKLERYSSIPEATFDTPNSSINENEGPNVDKNEIILQTTAGGKDKKPFRPTGLLNKSHLKLASYIKDNKDVKLAGTKRFEDKSGEYYLKNIQLQNSKKSEPKFDKRLSLTNPTNLENCLKTNMNRLKHRASKIVTLLPENSLTPIPMKMEKSNQEEVAGKYKNKKLKDAERTAVFIRRMEYSTSMKRQLRKDKDDFDRMNKITLIQGWWKVMNKVIKIQKHMRGFLFRKKLMDKLTHEERLLQFITEFDNIYFFHLYKQFFDYLKKNAESQRAKEIEKCEDFSEKMDNLEKLRELKNLKEHFNKWRKNVFQKKYKPYIEPSLPLNKNSNPLFHQFDKIDEIMRDKEKFIQDIKKFNLVGPKNSRKEPKINKEKIKEQLKIVEEKVRKKNKFDLAGPKSSKKLRPITHSYPPELEKKENHQKSENAKNIENKKNEPNSPNKNNTLFFKDKNNKFKGQNKPNELKDNNNVKTIIDQLKALDEAIRKKEKFNLNMKPSNKLQKLKLKSSPIKDEKDYKQDKINKIKPNISKQFKDIDEAIRKKEKLNLSMKPSNKLPRMERIQFPRKNKTDNKPDEFEQNAPTIPKQLKALDEAIRKKEKFNLNMKPSNKLQRLKLVNSPIKDEKDYKKNKINQIKPNISKQFKDIDEAIRKKEKLNLSMKPSNKLPRMERIIFSIKDEKDNNQDNDGQKVPTIPKQFKDVDIAIRKKEKLNPNIKPSKKLRKLKEMSSPKKNKKDNKPDKFAKNEPTILKQLKNVIEVIRNKEKFKLNQEPANKMPFINDLKNILLLDKKDPNRPASRINRPKSDKKSPKRKFEKENFNKNPRSDRDENKYEPNEESPKKRFKVGPEEDERDLSNHKKKAPYAFKTNKDLNKYPKNKFKTGPEEKERIVSKDKPNYPSNIREDKKEWSNKMNKKSKKPYEPNEKKDKNDKKDEPNKKKLISQNKNLDNLLNSSDSEENNNNNTIRRKFKTGPEENEREGKQKKTILIQMLDIDEFLREKPKFNLDIEPSKRLPYIEKYYMPKQFNNFDKGLDNRMLLRDAFDKWKNIKDKEAIKDELLKKRRRQLLNNVNKGVKKIDDLLNKLFKKDAFDKWRDLIEKLVIREKLLKKRRRQILDNVNKGAKKVDDLSNKLLKKDALNKWKNIKDKILKKRRRQLLDNIKKGIKKVDDLSNKLLKKDALNKWKNIKDKILKKIRRQLLDNIKKGVKRIDDLIKKLLKKDAFDKLKKNGQKTNKSSPHRRKSKKGRLKRRDKKLLRRAFIKWKENTTKKEKTYTPEDFKKNKENENDDVLKRLKKQTMRIIFNIKRNQDNSILENAFDKWHKITRNDKKPKKKKYEPSLKETRKTEDLDYLYIPQKFCRLLKKYKNKTNLPIKKDLIDNITKKPNKANKFSELLKKYSNRIISPPKKDFVNIVANECNPNCRFCKLIKKYTKKKILPPKKDLLKNIKKDTIDSNRRRRPLVLPAKNNYRNKNNDKDNRKREDDRNDRIDRDDKPFNKNLNTNPSIRNNYRNRDFDTYKNPKKSETTSVDESERSKVHFVEKSKEVKEPLENGSSSIYIDKKIEYNKNNDYNYNGKPKPLELKEEIENNPNISKEKKPQNKVLNFSYKFAQIVVKKEEILQDEDNQEKDRLKRLLDKYNNTSKNKFLNQNVENPDNEIYYKKSNEPEDKWNNISYSLNNKKFRFKFLNDIKFEQVRDNKNNKFGFTEKYATITEATLEKMEKKYEKDTIGSYMDLNNKVNTSYTYLPFNSKEISSPKFYRSPHRSPMRGYNNENTTNDKPIYNIKKVFNEPKNGKSNYENDNYAYFPKTTKGREPNNYRFRKFEVQNVMEDNES